MTEHYHGAASSDPPNGGEHRQLRPPHTEPVEPYSSVLTRLATNYVQSRGIALNTGSFGLEKYRTLVGSAIARSQQYWDSKVVRVSRTLQPSEEYDQTDPAIEAASLKVVSTALEVITDAPVPNRSRFGVAFTEAAYNDPLGVARRVQAYNERDSHIDLGDLDSQLLERALRLVRIGLVEAGVGIHQDEAVSVLTDSFLTDITMVRRRTMGLPEVSENSLAFALSVVESLETIHESQAGLLRQRDLLVRHYLEGRRSYSLEHHEQAMAIANDTMLEMVNFVTEGDNRDTTRMGAIYFAVAVNDPIRVSWQFKRYYTEVANPVIAKNSLAMANRLLRTATGLTEADILAIEIDEATQEYQDPPETIVDFNEDTVILDEPPETGTENNKETEE